MKKSIIKMVALVTLSALLISNVSVFAYGNTNKGYDKHLQKVENQVKEYVRVGEITEIHPNNIVIGEKSGKVIFRITDKTTIIDAKDKNIKLSSLKVGMEVEISYNKTSNSKKEKSFEANSIQLVDEDFCEISSAVIEEITTNTDDTLLVNVSYETVDSKNRTVENAMNLVVDLNTEIYNQFGNKILKSLLKVGMVIDIEHSSAITKSFVPQSYAYRINIIKENFDSVLIESKILEKNIYNNNEYILIGNADKVTEQLLLVLSDKTIIKDELGKNISFADLKVGQIVQVEHSTFTTRSIPAQAQVYSIRILENKNYIAIENATIESIDYKNSKVTINYEEEYNNKIYEETLVLLIDKDTILKNELGKAISINDLKAGMIVNAKHAEAVTFSIPGQTKAYEINIVGDQTVVTVENATIESVSSKNNKVTINYEEKYNNKVYTETLVLLIDTETVIKNASGKQISINDLKEGMIIDVKHSSASTLSIPAQTLAYSISVKSSSNPPVNEELKDIYELLDKLFKELGVKDWKESLKGFDFDFDDDDDIEDMIEDIVEHVLGDDYDDDDDDDDMEDRVENLIEKLIKELKVSNKNFKNSNRDDD